MSDAQLAALEAIGLAAGPDDTPDLSAHLAGEAPAYEGDDFEAESAVADLITEQAFTETMWGPAHDMMGGMVQMRSGVPCPLGDQARSAGGQIAASALYALLSANSFLAGMFLSPGSTFIGQVVAIGMHGFTCVQLVKMSQAGATPQ